MPRLRYSTPILLALTVLSVARAGTAPNSLEIVVENGPLAGTYKADPAAIICIHARKQKTFSAAFKTFTAGGPKVLAEAGIEVLSPDAAGQKHGNVRVAFGGSDKSAAVYALNYADVTLVLGPAHGIARFQGQTPEHIRIKLTATCNDIDNF